MIPSTTFTWLGFTASGMRTTTAETAAAVPAASHYGSVASHSGPNLLQGQEYPPLWRTLLQRPVLQLPLKKIENGSLIKKLPVDDQHQLMKEIRQIQSDTARLVHEETEALRSEENKNLTAKINLLNSEITERKKEHGKLKKGSENAIQKVQRQLKKSKTRYTKAEDRIERMEKKLKDQKSSLEESLQEMADLKARITLAVGCSVASATRPNEAISSDNLIEKVSALKEK